MKNLVYINVDVSEILRFALNDRLLLFLSFLLSDDQHEEYFRLVLSL